MQFCSVTDAPVEVRAEGEHRTIRGRAATFNSLSHDLGGYREKINSRAFDRTLEDIVAGRNHVSARIQHDGGLSIVGTTKNGSLRLFKDSGGLNYELTSLPDTQSARDLMTLVSGGYINKSSFAFSVPDRANGMRWDYTTNPPTRELLDVDLIDVAPVDGPAYEATSVEARAMALASMREAGPVVDINVLDEIMPTWLSRYMPDGVSSGKVIEALAAVPDAKAINVIINSPGGDVFEAHAIYNTLKAHSAPVNVEVRGLAASAAGIIAMAGDTITMGEGSFLMIHNAWTVTAGNANDLRDQAVFLDRIDAEIAGILAGRSGNSTEDVRQLMKDETWMNAEEAIAAGFATAKQGVAEPINAERCRELQYRNIPRELGGPGNIETRTRVCADDILAHAQRELKRTL